MSKISISQTNFSAGEFSPKLYGRFDIAQYINAAKTLENNLIHLAGGGFRRPGLKYVSEIKTSSAKTRLIVFEFSTTQTYILELGNLYTRFYRNQGQIDTTTMSITGATAANPVVVTMADHPFANGDSITITGVVGMTELNGNSYTVANRTDDTVELQGIDGTGYSAYSSGGTSTRSGACEIITPYTTAQLFKLQFAQDADTMWIVHPSHKPQKLTRAAHTEWTISDYAPTADVFTSTDNYPSCVAMLEQRIWFGNTNNAPQKIFGSKSGDFEDMTTGINAGDGFTYVVASDKVNAFRWFKPDSKGLQIGTLGGTLSLNSGSDSLAVTPTNVTVKRNTTYGAANIMPEMIGSFIYYVERDLNHLRELGYSFDIDKQEAIDMTKLSDHIAKAADPLDSDGFTQIAYQQSPVSRLWCVRNDGQIAVFTRQVEEKVMGWSRQIAGSDSRDSGKFESVAIIPKDEGDDEVWVIVKRYINGATVRYIEYFMPERFDHQQDAFFVDSGLSLDSPKTITNIVTKTVLDDMEYASDAAAQAAYVSSDTIGYGSNFVTGGTPSASNANASFPVTNSVDAVLTTYWNADTAPPQWWKYDLGNGVTKAATKLRLYGRPSGTGIIKDFTLAGSNDDINWTNIHTDTVPDSLGWHDFTFTNTTSYRYYRVTITTTWRSDAVIGIYEIEMMESLANTQCYSENVLYQQGSYSLKVVAQITDSLNDTLTRTPASAIDLTGLNSIKLNVRASRTGSNFKIGFKDAGGTTTEHTVNIAAADTWQTETIDISGVATADKDAINSIIITILNADATNTFYIDNVYAPATAVTVTATSHNFSTDDKVKIVDVVGMTEVNDIVFIIVKVDANSFTLKDEAGTVIDGSAYTAYISGGEARKLVTLITGLTHLVGETVAITVDGLSVTTKIVNSSGEITLDARAFLVHIGLPYTSDIELLPYPEGSETGTAIGKVQRTYKLIVKLYQSLSFQYGPDANNLDTESITSLFTGDKVVSFPGDWSREAGLLIRQTEPLPLNVLAVTRIATVSEE